MEDSIATIVSSFTLTSRGRRPLLAAQRPALFWKPCSLCQHFQWGKSRIMERAAHIQIIPNRELARAKIHHRSMSMAARVPWMLGMADTMWASIAPLRVDFGMIGLVLGACAMAIFVWSYLDYNSIPTLKVDLTEQERTQGHLEQDLKPSKSGKHPRARGSANRTAKWFATTPPRLTF